MTRIELDSHHNPKVKMTSEARKLVGPNEWNSFVSCERGCEKVHTVQVLSRSRRVWLFRRGVSDVVHPSKRVWLIGKGVIDVDDVWHACVINPQRRLKVLQGISANQQPPQRQPTASKKWRTRTTTNTTSFRPMAQMRCQLRIVSNILFLWLPGAVFRSGTSFTKSNNRSITQTHYEISSPSTLLRTAASRPSGG
jgi:hypothetical protein